MSDAGTVGWMLGSQLIVSPLLAFEAWLYLRGSARGRRGFDVAVVALAGIACVATLPPIAASSSAGNDAVWRAVLATLSAFFVFPAVLALGAAIRAWRYRYHMSRDSSTVS